VTPVRVSIVGAIASVLLILVVLELVRGRRLKERYALLWLATGVVLLVLSIWRDGLNTIAGWAANQASLKDVLNARVGSLLNKLHLSLLLTGGLALLSLLIAFLTVTLTSVGAIAAFVNITTRPVLVNSANQALLNAAVQTKTRIDQFISESQEEFKQEAALPDVVEYLSTPSAQRSGSRLEQDIAALAHPVLRHRVLTNFHAESEGKTKGDMVDMLLEAVRIPASGM